MAEEFSDPIASEQGGAKKNILLIVVVTLIIMCCCCFAGVAGLFYGTEPVMDLLGIPIPW